MLNKANPRTGLSARPVGCLLLREAGISLCSQAVASQVPSALEGLTSVFGMGTGGTPPPSPPESFQMSFDNHTSSGKRSLPSSFGQALDRLVPVSSICCHTYTPGLSTSSSPRGLTRLFCGRSHLGAGFALRCFQRLSFPDAAFQPCHWRDNWYTVDPVSYTHLTLPTTERV